MARVAVFSDIHGNYAGLVEMLGHATQQGCEKFVCLGDVADGWQDGGLCVDELRRRGIPTVRGNHDELPSEGVSPEQAVWLRSRPLEIRIGEIVYTHISPDGNERKLSSSGRVWNALDNRRDFQVAFVGHLHFPILFAQDPRDPMQIRTPAWKYHQPYVFNEQWRYVICVGAVGYPRDGLRKIRYAIYDDEANAMEFVRLDGTLLPYGVWTS